MVSFAKGATYTRSDVQDILGVTERDGAWDTGYTRFQDALYVFCNVGAVGRTGHDYGNEWVGDELLWSAKTGSHLGQPLMKQVVSGELPVRVFWREDNKKPFTYAGQVSRLRVAKADPLMFSLVFAEIDRVGSNERITVQDLLNRGGRLFAKSEFGPIHQGWPAVAFSDRKTASDLVTDFKRGRDFVLFVGTTDPSRTENIDHRSRILSAVSFEPKAPISTNQIVAPEYWNRSVSKWGVRWEWALPVEDAYDFSPFLDARRFIPETYAKLGSLEFLGRCVELTSVEIERLADSTLVRKTLHQAPAVSRALALNVADDDVRRALSRMAISIDKRIQESGGVAVRSNPVRTGPNLSDIQIGLTQKWKEQEGCCGLCGKPMHPNPTNRLLQPSPDRIESYIKSYEPENLHLSHLGCNLAKNNATMEEWAEFLAMLRSESEVE